MSSHMSQVEAAEAQRIAAGCPECGMPADECYNLCPNSPAYYSREREMMDEPFYGQDDVSERYAADIIDGELESEYAAIMDEEAIDATMILRAADLDDSDLPF